MTEILDTPAAKPLARLLLAHGAGAPMDSAFMNLMTEMLVARRISVARFEFPYMAARRSGGAKKPAPKAETLQPAFLAAIDDCPGDAPLFIGGKSMGGRVASMIAETSFAAQKIAGLVCLGYPFHPPNTPTTMRTAHLLALTIPTLIVQGERDPFGTRTEIEALTLSPAIHYHWCPDGDHDLGPRGRSGHTRKGNLESAADAVAGFTAATLPIAN